MKSGCGVPNRVSVNRSDPGCRKTRPDDSKGIQRQVEIRERYSALTVSLEELDFPRLPVPLDRPAQALVERRGRELDLDESTGTRKDDGFEELEQNAWSAKETAAKSPALTDVLVRGILVQTRSGRSRAERNKADIRQCGQVVVPKVENISEGGEGDVILRQAALLARSTFAQTVRGSLHTSSAKMRRSLLDWFRAARQASNALTSLRRSERDV